MTYVYMKRPSTAPRPHASPRYDTLMGIGLVVVYASNVTQNHSNHRAWYSLLFVRAAVIDVWRENVPTGCGGE